MENDAFHFYFKPYYKKDLAICKLGLNPLMFSCISSVCEKKPLILMVTLNIIIVHRNTSVYLYLFFSS